MSKEFARHGLGHRIGHHHDAIPIVGLGRSILDERVMDPTVAGDRKIVDPVDVGAVVVVALEPRGRELGELQG